MDGKIADRWTIGRTDSGTYIIDTQKDQLDNETRERNTNR